MSIFAIINIWAVLIAALSVFVLGGLWYSPIMFGKTWGRLAGMDSSKHHHSALVFIFSFLFSLIAASVFALFLGPQPPLVYAISVGFITGLCWVGTSFGINYLFAGRKVKMLLIDAGYHIVQFSLYGLILGLWH